MDSSEELTLQLADLPDVILVRIMSFLSLPDRYSLMQTCRRMLDIFQHPSLWYYLKIQTLKSNYPDIHKYKLRRFVDMIESVGHCCQELEFHFEGTYCKMDDDVREFIHNLSEKCRLETLVVSFEYKNLKHMPRSSFIGPALREDTDTLCSVVSRCCRLKTFCIRKWPVFSQTDPARNEILDALCENEKLMKLEKLHLFWPDRNETTWASVKTNHTPEYAFKVVDHFKNLTTLSLISPVVSEKLLKALAAPNRTILEYLRVMVVNRQDKPLQFSDSCWNNLRPQLKVEIVFSSRIPSEAMFVLLQPSLPLYKLHFMKYSKCSPEDLSNIALLYNQTLVKFVDETDSANGPQLLKLAHVCDHLRCVTYHGTISYRDVIELARIKGKDWYELVIAEAGIEYEEKLVTKDEDKVLDKDGQGEYYLVAVHRWGDTDESLAEKASRRDMMVERVTEELGVKWQPLNVSSASDAAP